MNSPLSDLGNMMVVWDSDDLAGALDPGEEDDRPARGSDEAPATRAIGHLHVLDNGICTSCDPNDLLDEDSAALLAALGEMDIPASGARMAWTPTQAAKHIRNPKGSPGGGRFRSNVDRLKDAIADHKAGKGGAHPFDGFNREQLRRVAKARGIALDRGEGRDSIAAKLLHHIGGAPSAKQAKAEEPAPLGFGDRMKGAARGRGALDAAPLSLLPRSRNDPRLAGDRRKLLSDFQLGEAGDIVRAVRNGGEISDETARRVAIVDAVMRDSPLASDVLLYRTFPTAWDFFGDGARGDLTGHEWVQNDFATVTANEPSPHVIGLVMRIVAPKGMGAVAMSAGDKEMLLDRKHTWRVIEDHGRKDGRRIVDIEILPKNGDEPDNFTVVKTNITSEHNPLTEDVRAALPDTPLGRSLASGVAGSESLSGGAVGDVRLATFTDGEKAVQKIARRTFAGRSTKDLTDGEELAALLGRSIDAPVPEVVRSGDNEVFMAYVPKARSATAVLRRFKAGDDRGQKVNEFVESRAGRLLGVLDLLADNHDRHQNNWLVHSDGTITGIDHGLTWSDRQTSADVRSVAPTFDSPFAAAFYRNAWLPNDLSKADIDWMRERVSALRPQFEARDRAAWLDYSLARLDQLGAMATGTKDRVRP